MKEKQDFQWKRHPDAEMLLYEFLFLFEGKNSWIKNLAESLKKHTSTRLFDWIDHFVVFPSDDLLKRMENAGFVNQQDMIYCHPGAQLPRIVCAAEQDHPEGIAVKVESCAEFLLVHGVSSDIEGSPFSRFRRALINKHQDIALWVVERRCYPEIQPCYTSEKQVSEYLLAREKWEKRKRAIENEDLAIDNAIQVANEMVQMIGCDLAASAVLEVERKYWQARNHAGQVQKNRQDKLGMGWANHDHHTFRSSRKYFSQLVHLFEILGFHCRERFYAGEEAGWGAQVMEHCGAGLVLFLDLDLSPEELQIDFSHQKLPELPALGTVGLWCALHGDSILTAGMHHLEAQFAFEDLADDLYHHGIGMMQPFSDFSYLKQAFSEGEQWAVDPKRLDRLLSEGKITFDQKKHFLDCGAVGSHLENLQRKEGYKGFNQKNVSFIIKKTDPRECFHTT